MLKTPRGWITDAPGWKRLLAVCLGDEVIKIMWGGGYAIGYRWRREIYFMEYLSEEEIIRRAFESHRQ